MSKITVENLNKEIKSLMDKHFDLEKSVAVSEKNLSSDNLEIEKLKKEKLKIKDDLLEKQNQLKSLLNNE